MTTSVTLPYYYFIIAQRIDNRLGTISVCNTACDIVESIVATVNEAMPQNTTGSHSTIPKHRLAAFAASLCLKLLNFEMLCR